MRNLFQLDEERVRRDVSQSVTGLWGFTGNETCGAFMVRKLTAKGHLVFRVIASAGGGWDHVSVSLPNRCPTWDEMTWIAELFFEPHETLIQYRPPVRDYVNTHPHCLHWWRPHDVSVPLPPVDFV